MTNDSMTNTEAEREPEWVIVHRPGLLPDRKGPFYDNKHIEEMLRGLYDLYPDCICTVITMPHTSYPQSGREWIDMYGDKRRKPLPASQRSSYTSPDGYSISRNHDGQGLLLKDGKVIWIIKDLLKAASGYRVPEVTRQDVRVHLGEKLFSFSNHAQWVNKAQSWFTNYGVSSRDAICLDQHGRVCTIGLHMKEADQDGAFPVDVYRMRPAASPSPSEQKEAQSSLTHQTDDSADEKGRE